MGFELTRFCGEIDEEFLCPICKLVLEDPVQTPCEHSFCNECIKSWLSTTKSCPIDRTPLLISDLKPLSRAHRNLWNNLDVLCDFLLQGCSRILKLENFKAHVDSCEYNLNTEVVCDKGCNMTITRWEYKNINCITHLVNRLAVQGNDNIKLSKELHDQKEHFEQIVTLLHEENRKLNCEITKLNDVVSSQRYQLEHFQNAMISQQLSERSNTFIRPLKWVIFNNVKIEERNILKVHNPCTFGSVKSEYPLEPTKPFFKVHVLGIEKRNYRYTWIGLHPKKQTGFAHADIVYTDAGTIGVNGDIVHHGPEWEIGDIIECGIKFPNNFIDYEHYNVTLYFTRNEELIYELPSINIAKDGLLFPSIRLQGEDCSFKYYQ